jgi:cystathionine beta-synthase
MNKPFPFVDLKTPVSEISKLISKENTAVLVKKQTADLAIITEFDLIEAMA